MAEFRFVSNDKRKVAVLEADDYAAAREQVDLNVFAGGFCQQIFGDGDWEMADPCIKVEAGCG